MQELQMTTTDIIPSPAESRPPQAVLSLLKRALAKVDRLLHASAPTKAARREMIEEIDRSCRCEHCGNVAIYSDNRNARLLALSSAASSVLEMMAADLNWADMIRGNADRVAA
jgi:hypothetical protein